MLTSTPCGHAENALNYELKSGTFIMQRSTKLSLHKSVSGLNTFICNLLFMIGYAHLYVKWATPAQ